MSEASKEFERFSAAIQQPQPATQVFTQEALMLVYLMLGKEALK